jgi:hypothetical protein
MASRTIASLEQAYPQVVQLLSSATGIEQAAADLLELLARSSGSQWGTYWHVDPQGHVLRPLKTWSIESEPHPELERHTLNRTLSLSEGAAGHVWRSRKPMWTVDLTKDMCLPRSLDAEASGLHGGIWFALKSDQAVYGIIELLGKSLPHPTVDALLGIERLGIKLGQMIESKHLARVSASPAKPKSSSA